MFSSSNVLGCQLPTLPFQEYSLTFVIDSIKANKILKLIFTNSQDVLDMHLEQSCIWYRLFSIYMRFPFQHLIILQWSLLLALLRIKEGIIWPFGMALSLIVKAKKLSGRLLWGSLMKIHKGWIKMPLLGLVLPRLVVGRLYWILCLIIIWVILTSDFCIFIDMFKDFYFILNFGYWSVGLF